MNDDQYIAMSDSLMSCHEKIHRIKDEINTLFEEIKDINMRITTVAQERPQATKFERQVVSTEAGLLHLQEAMNQHEVRIDRLERAFLEVVETLRQDSATPELLNLEAEISGGDEDIEVRPKEVLE